MKNRREWLLFGLPWLIIFVVFSIKFPSNNPENIIGNLGLTFVLAGSIRFFVGMFTDQTKELIKVLYAKHTLVKDSVIQEKNKAAGIIPITKDQVKKFEEIRNVFQEKGEVSTDITPAIIRGMEYYMYAIYVVKEDGKIIIRHLDGREEDYNPLQYVFP